ncbi:hypothetical protein SH661x_001081 [Planctomicrobium sp. SH661]|uniref:hypothetical protein n=1 Tax=Planctomicrobium sp. SH661 TaxID=3448124 RepID=UPI003F5B8F91
MYVDAAIANGHEDPVFYWIFIEDSGDYDINVIQADADDIAMGRDLYRSILDQWIRAQKQGKYHGYLYNLRAIPTGGLPEYEKERWRAARNYEGDTGDPDPVGAGGETF